MPGGYNVLVVPAVRMIRWFDTPYAYDAFTVIAALLQFAAIAAVVAPRV